MLDVSRIKITTREEQVLSLLVLGCSNREIAGELNMATGAVKEHLRNFVQTG
jgi:ATP/maltotriose-dependent transcriptional regulator MalT